MPQSSSAASEESRFTVMSARWKSWPCLISQILIYSYVSKLSQAEDSHYYEVHMQSFVANRYLNMHVVLTIPLGNRDSGQYRQEAKR